MSTKTILHLTPAYYPHLGGVEQHVTKVCQELGRRGFQNIILTLRLQADWPLLTFDQSSTIIRLNIGADPGKNSGWLKSHLYKLQLWWQVARHFNLFLQSDMIQIHDVWWWLWPFRLILPKSKLFITFHGYEGSQNPNQKQIRAHQRAVSMTNGNLCIGGFHKKWYGIKPTLVSFGAVERDSNEKESQVGKRVRHDNQFNLIYAGRLDADVGILEYLHGLKLLLEKSPNRQTHLDVFGEGQLLIQAETYVKQHNLPVKFHGWVKSKKIHWSKYDIALVSRHLAIIEALAHGLPVIAHYNSPIKKDYLLMSPFARWIKVFETPSQFAKIITSLNQPPQAAKTWAKRQTWKKMADLYEILWKM